MKISRERLPKIRPNLPAEVYYVASGRALGYRVVGFGSTPTKAKLNWLWDCDRRRHHVED